MPHRRRGAGARWRGTLLRVPFIFAVVCSACAAPAPGPVSVQIAVHPAASVAKPAYVEVGGLSNADLSSLRDRPMTASEWSSLLKIFVGDVGPGLGDVASGVGDVGSGVGDVVFDVGDADPASAGLIPRQRSSVATPSPVRPSRLRRFIPWIRDARTAWCSTRHIFHVRASLHQSLLSCGFRQSRLSPRECWPCTRRPVSFRRISCACTSSSPRRWGTRAAWIS